MSGKYLTHEALRSLKKMLEKADFAELESEFLGNILRADPDGFIRRGEVQSYFRLLLEMVIKPLISQDRKGDRVDD